MFGGKLKIHRRIAAVGLAGLTAATMVLTLAPAAGATVLANSVATQGQTSISDNDEAKLREFWTQYEVAPSTQNALVQKLRAGGTVDALTDGAQPTSTRTVSSETDDVTVTSFADGSIQITGVEKPLEEAEGAISPMSVGSCRTSGSGSGYNTYYDCKAYLSNGFVDLGFYITYTIVAGTGYDYIVEVNSPYAYGIGGTASTPTLAIGRKTEYAGGSAWAYARTSYSGVNGGGRTYEMRALVGSNRTLTIWA